MTPRTLPTYFISHGGGPWPWMKDQTNGGYDLLEASLQAMPRQVGVKPRAVLVISGHWEEREFAIMSSPNPPMLYDYSGFPPHTYRVKYPAPGAPEIADRVAGLIRGAGMATQLDAERGFDHGVFAPLAVIYPDAEVPVLQLSMRRSYDPAEHIAVGRALAPLRDEGVLIVGSGLSYYNLREMGPRGKVPSAAFDDWLQATLVGAEASERAERLIGWETAPAARMAHPQEDHLLPLMVAVGAAGNDPGVCVYHEDGFFGGITVSSFMFARG